MIGTDEGMHTLAAQHTPSPVFECVCMKESDLRKIQQSREHEWEVRLERAPQLGKSASHSRITETISLQETGGTDTDTHIYTCRHAKHPDG